MNTKDVVDLLKELRGPTISREITYVLSGFLALLLTCFIYHLRPDQISVMNYLTSVIWKFLTVIILSWGFARICSEVASVLTIFILNIIKGKKHRKLHAKNYWEKLDRYAKREATFIDKNNDLTHTEIDKFIGQTPHLSFINERKVQHFILEKVAFGFLFVISISLFLSHIPNHYFLSALFFILFLALSWLHINTHIESFESKLEIAQFLSNQSTGL